MLVVFKRLATAAAFSVFLFSAAIVLLTAAAAAQSNRRVIAIFAHPDDERVVGPLLSRLAREGREVHLVIATDGSKGVRNHAGIPAGSQLAAARINEAQCAAKRLRVHQLHMIGMEDGSLGMSMMAIAELRTRLSVIIARVRPDVIITFGPEGGTGHPDHRLVGNVTTEIVQRIEWHRAVKLFYASLPAERLRSAPPSMPTVSGVAEELLSTRVPFEQQDLIAGRESFACHATQYTAAEMKSINRTLTHVWNGFVYLRPFNGSGDPIDVFRP
jgi:LmbE family N-acetylglucosaminyl deacetylase